MQYCVGEKAIKMTFIQTSPGKEKEVSAQIVEKCRTLYEQGKITDFHVMLGLGGFDVIVIYETGDFEAYLTQEGAITGINKVSRCYCFQYDPESNFFRSLKENSFAGIRLYKLNPSSNSSVLSTMEDFFDDYKSVLKTDIETFFFGTLGWNEIVVLVVGGDIDKIGKEVFWVSRPEKALQLYKTQSYLCLNLDVPCSDTLPAIKRKLGTDRKKQKINFETGSVKPTVYISAFPACCNEIYNWWLQYDDILVYEILGKDDLVVTPKNHINLLELIACVTNFRKEFSNKIVSTNTVITYVPEKQKLNRKYPKPFQGEDYKDYYVREDDVMSWRKLVDLILKEDHSTARIMNIFDDEFKKELGKGRITKKKKLNIICKFNKFIDTTSPLTIPAKSSLTNKLRYITGELLNSDRIIRDQYARMQIRRRVIEDIYSVTTKSDHLIYYDFADIVSKFDITASIKYASLINSLNGMLQNRLLRDSFFDMMSYVTTVLVRCNHEEKEVNIAKIHFLIELIKSGAEIRSYGTHGAIEDITGQFTKMRGGIQRFLIAAEFIAHKCFLSCSRMMWEGFIVVDTERFSEYEEIISLPMGCLWKVERIWPIYHEISHTLINFVNLVDIRFPEIAKFMIKKTKKDIWVLMLNEFAADIITFEICFFNDFPHYKESFCTEYIESSPRNEVVDIIALLLRLYIVEVFYYCFVEKKYDLSFFQNKNEAYKDILRFLDTVDKTIIMKLPEIRNKYFIAAEYHEIIKQLYPWLELLYIKCAEFKVIDTHLIGLRELISPTLIAREIKNNYDSSLARYINRNIVVFKDEFDSFDCMEIPVNDFVLEILDIVNKMILNPDELIKNKLYVDKMVPKRIQKLLVSALSSKDKSAAARQVFEAFFKGAISKHTIMENKLTCSNTKNAYESITHFHPFPKKVDYPEALIYLLSKIKKKNFGNDIAMMLTFSNCYDTEMAKGMAER